MENQGNSEIILTITDWKQFNNLTMKVCNSFSLNLVLRIKYTHANFPSVIVIIVLFRRPSSHWWWCRGACNCQFIICIRNWRLCSFFLKNCLNHRICSFRFLWNRSCWVVTDRIDRTFKSVILCTNNRTSWSQCFPKTAEVSFWSFSHLAGKLQVQWLFRSGDGII